MTYALLLALALVMVTLLVVESGRARSVPVLFHNLAWVLALGLFASGLVHYSAVTRQAWIAITLGIASFNLGALVPALVNRQDRVAGRGSRAELDRRSFVSQRVFLALVAGYALGVVLYLRAVASQFGIHTLLTHPGSVRASQGSEGFVAAFSLPARLLFFLGPLVFVLLINPDFIRGKGFGRLRWLVAAVVLATLALALGRTLLFVGLAWEAGLVFFGFLPSMGVRSRFAGLVPRSRAARFASLIALALLCVIGFQVLAGLLGKTARTDERVQPFVSRPLQASPWTSSAVYASAGLPAFSKLVESGPKPSLGTATFSAILRVVPIAKAQQEVSPFTSIPFPFNAYTWLEPYYRDFGVAGAVLLPFAVGLIISELANRPRLGGAGTVALALLMGLTLWAPFVNKYVSTFTYEYLIILALLARFSRGARPSAGVAPRSGVREYRREIARR
jgi:hypothetical protein